MKDILTIPGSIALSADPAMIGLQSAVIRDAEGVPVAWRLLKNGVNKGTVSGDPWQFDLTDEVLAKIMDYFRTKGTRVPLDSRHFLFYLAQEYGKTEDEISSLLGGYGTFAYGDLNTRDDGLWIENVEYVPLARQLMKQGVFTYFSPVIRGLSTGIFRVTSVTFTNEPALNGIDALAAEADTAGPDIKYLTGRINAMRETTNKEKKAMKKFLPALAMLLSMDAVALDAEGNVPEDVLTRLGNLKKELDSVKDLRKNCRDALALGADAGDPAILAALKGLAVRAAEADTLKQRVDALALESDTRKLNDVIARGKAEGKLDNDMVDNWVKPQKLDAVALEAYLQHAPVKVPVRPLDRSGLNTDADVVALTAEDREAARQAGITEEEMLNEKKEGLKNRS